MRDIRETSFGDSSNGSHDRLGVLAVGSEAWVAAASNEQVIDLVYEQYTGLASRIDDLTTGLPEDERVRHMGAQIRPGDTRTILDDDVLGDFPMFVGRASRRFERDALETGDFTQCLTLAFTLEDPVLASHLFAIINLKRISPEAFAHTGSSELDRHPDPGLQLWRHGRMSMAERRNQGIEEFQAALKSHARREATFVIDSALRRELNEEDTSVVHSLRIAAYIKRFLRLGGKRQTKQVRKLIVEQLEEISGGQTVPERLFVESLHALPIINSAEV